MDQIGSRDSIRSFPINNDRLSYPLLFSCLHLPMSLFLFLPPMEKSRQHYDL